MEHKIIVAGIGPGAKEYVIPMAMQAINEANVLVGGTRALNEFSHQGQKTFTIKADISAVMDFIKVELNDNDVVVMVSGDPGYYSLLSALRKNFSFRKYKSNSGTKFHANSFC